MQLLYGCLTGGEADSDTLSMAYDEMSIAQKNAPGKVKPTPDDSAYIEQVLSGVKEHADELDDLIRRHCSDDWTLDRLPRVDLSILRLCVYEIYHRDDVPDNVAISEAMELAGKYSEPKSSRFINGVLGSIAREKLGEGR